MHQKRERSALSFPRQARVLVVEARYYTDVSDHLFAGTQAVLDASGVQYDRVIVPGALEIPAAVVMAEQAKFLGTLERPYDGYVALGCVIRGATTHYETVCNESAHGLMNAATEYGAAIGNGILTCENMDQAMERARADQMDKGGDAAYAALKMMELRVKLGMFDPVPMMDDEDMAA